MLWINTTTGYQCLIRQGFGRVLCGYVGVERSHRLYGRPMDDDALDSIRVHGGLTFSDYWPDINRLWYFGFDCGHFMDIIPDWVSPIETQNRKVATGEADIETICNNELSSLISAFMKNSAFTPTYKDLNFVAAEVESLAHQLKVLE